MTIALTVAFALILITAYAKRIQETPATVGVTAVRKLHDAELESVGQIVARGIDSAPQVPGVFENRDCGLYPAIEDEDIVDITDQVEMIPSDDEIAKKAAAEKAAAERAAAEKVAAERAAAEKIAADTIVERILGRLADAYDLDSEIQELEAKQRELRSRLVAARSNKRLAEIFLN